MNQAISDTFINLPLICDYIIKITCGSHTFTHTSFAEKPEDFLERSTNNNVKKLLDILDKHYYNTASPIVSDVVYDLFSDHYYNISGDDKNSTIGAEIQGSKTKLPIHMGSMDKLKPGQPALTKFLADYTHDKVLSSKLDGISLLIGKTLNGPRAYTRGNGCFGKDVTKFLKYLKTKSGKNLYDIVSTFEANTYVRGELIISKANWVKFSHLGSNARNTAMGIMNRKLITDEVAICEFLGYQYISNECLSIASQFNKIQQYAIDTPKHVLYSSAAVTPDSLPAILEEFKASSKYEIDGVIIQDNIYYPMNESKNPKYAKAFKMEKYNESGVSTINSIEWRPSKSGVWKPIIIIHPVQLSNVVIKRVFGYNAKYIVDSGLGAGAQVEIIRSGDVIPKITKVLIKQFAESDFPENYIWGPNRLDIFVLDAGSNKEVLLSQLEYFVKTIGVDFCKKSTLRKLYTTGIHSVKDFIRISSIDKILAVKGVNAKLGTKIFNSILHTFKNLDEGTFIASLPIYNGISKIRMVKILNNIPDFYTLPPDLVHYKISNIKGFSTKIADLISGSLEDCKEYIVLFKTMYTSFRLPDPTPQAVSDEYKDQVICFSGVRDKVLEKKITKGGGTVVQSMHKNVTELIVADQDKVTQKTKTALKFGIQITLYSEF